MSHPFQIVTFFDREPEAGEYVYQGDNGWYPQVALKRRFGFNGLSEEQGIELIDAYLAMREPFEINFGQRIKPEHMLVEVIEVVPDAAVLAFHQDFIAAMGEQIVSKYPDREGANYFPHMTVAWKGETVVEPGTFENTSRVISSVWLLKDAGDAGDSQVYGKFELTT